MGFRGGPALSSSQRFSRHSGIRFGSGFRRPGFRPRFRHRAFFSSYSPYYFGYSAYPLYYGDDSYAAADYYPGYDYYGNASSQASNDIARQQQDIDRLENEVATLREERETRPVGPQKAPAEVSSPPTVLVFRDRHTQEVQNYAVVGGTLWIFNEQHATKLPLSWLDIEATAKANDERGVDFRVPN